MPRPILPLPRWIPILVALAGCGKETLPQKPQLVLDRDAIVFDTHYVGQKPTQGLEIGNGGLENLLIESATLSGDSAFSLSGPTGTEVKGKQHVFVQVTFSPTAAKSYSSTLTIKSNAENAPTKTVPVSATAINP